MYLSKWQVEKRAVKNIYDVHRRLWQAFPNLGKKATRPFLFYMSEKLKFYELLMQSSYCPQLIKNADFNLLASKVFNPQFESQQHLSFLLCANPVKRPKQIIKKYNPRIPLLNEDERIQWLQRQLSGGAILEEVQIEAQNVLSFQKKQYMGTLVTATYSGVLQVDNVHQFIEKYQNGIGPAKGFGCGMMLIRKV